MKDNEAFNPVDVGALGAQAVVSHAQPAAHLVEQIGADWGMSFFLSRLLLFIFLATKNFNDLLLYQPDYTTPPGRFYDVFAVD